MVVCGDVVVGAVVGVCVVLSVVVGVFVVDCVVVIGACVNGTGHSASSRRVKLQKETACLFTKDVHHNLSDEGLAKKPPKKSMYEKTSYLLPT